MREDLDPRPGESDAAWRERVRQWFISVQETPHRGALQSEWEYVASLLGVQVPGPWDQPSGDLGPEASEQV